MTNIAVVVPVYNRRDVTLKFLEQFSRISSGVVGYQLDIVIVDDGSTDGTTEAIRMRYPSVKTLSGDGQLWWTGAVRTGVEYVLEHDYDAVLIMNDDLDLDEEFLSELLAVSTRHPGALVSSIKLNKLAGGGEQIIAAGFKVKGWLQQPEIVHADEPYHSDMADVIECDLLTGSSLFIPTNVFHQIGMFDSKKFPHHWGDFEFTRRASLAGFACLVATRSKVYTEYNPDYALPFMLKSSRLEYMRNLFNNKKHFYGFQSMAKSSYMHKNMFIGSVLFVRRFLGVIKLLLLKGILPNKILRKVMTSKSGMMEQQ